MKILLAEDDNLSSTVMRRTLQNFGYEVIVAQNGRAAVDILAQNDGPRLAVIDWLMPELDGLAVCREVRSRRSDGSYVYILLLTSKQSSEDIVAGLEAGADDYLTKPCQNAELKARLYTGMRILSLEETLVKAREEMRHKATHDGLTGIRNRASILSLAGSEMLRSSRENSPMSIMICDIDHFKRINDTYGHLTGDIVLKEVARRLKSTVRNYDAVGRYGGEEFLILLNDCDESALHARAEEIRACIASSPISANDQLIPVTISIGAAVCEEIDSKSPIERLFARADDALYQAKRQGRDRAVLALAFSCLKAG